MNFYLWSKSNLQLISRQQGGGKYMDSIGKADYIAIYHTSPIYDIHFYNLTNLNHKNNLLLER
jgi:hypothetical protein